MNKKKIILPALIIPIILVFISIIVYAATRYISEYDFRHANDIFCISKSQTFYEGTYTVHSEFTVGDSKLERALAYAICSRTEDASNNYTDRRADGYGDSAQWAVWKIIDDGGENLSYFNGYSLSQDTSEYTLYEDMYGWGESNAWRYAIYDRAMAYANYAGVNAPSNIVIGDKTSDNKVKIDLGNYNTSSSYTDTNPNPDVKVTLNNLGGVKSVKLTIDGKSTTYSGNNLDNHLDSSKRYFIVDNAENIGTLEVEVQYYEVKYTARGNVLTKTGSQYIISATGDKAEDVVATRKTTKVFNTDVSLQKYIIKVNEKDLTNNDNETTLINRKNTKTATNETNTNVKDNISGSPAETNKASNNYKRNNVVKIEAGDEVTYRIYVYNNSKVTATSILVKDTMPYIEKNGQVESLVDISSIKNASGNNITYTKDTVNKNTYYWTVSNLGSGQSTYFDVTLEFKTYTSSVLTNTAWISSTTPPNKTEYRTLDRDYVQMKPYRVSLQKIVYSVNGNTSGITSFNRWESWESNANVNNSPTNETYNRDNRYAKHNNPVTVANGDTVTYAVRVRNDGDTQANITQIVDTFPTGVSLKNVTNESGNQVSYTVNEQQITINEATGLLSKNQTQTYYVTVTVTESNMSTRLLRNYAEITKLINKNNVDVEDETQNNNQDADYIQLKDIIIAGTVWNDKALDKKQDNYNGEYDEGQENKLPGIKVMLYRDGKGVIATTTTDENGNYSFDASNIDSSVVTEQCERYIKAPYTCTSNYSGNVKHGSNYWKENNYYSYYVVFEYDGITYTSTVFSDVTSNNDKDSNAKEDNGKVQEKRKDFNDRFSTINNKSGIEYTTKNESGYLPQSNHIYNEKTMAMQSSTNKVSLSNTASLEQQLTHVNLGLRGRDVFDLSLTSDVYSTKVTVNGQDGTYNYNSNKVTVRKSDISVAEDAANFASETREASISEVNQAIRKTDLNVNAANNGATNGYKSTGLGIEVTYKITVTNESQTEGTASKVIDYYDSRYTFVKAYMRDTVLNTEAGESGTGFESVIITTTEKHLAQSATMDIYVVYKLNEPTSTLAALLSGTQTIPTYNMAEVYEYKTYTTNNNEATRGLLDKDSAPGSANTETVRLANGSSDKTTVKYYFDAQDLTNLKYEDDTYAAPTLYFTKDDNGRTLSGVVFRDSTTTDGTTRIKTGNGVKDEGEVGVYGATVELVEISDPGDAKSIAEGAGTTRYTVKTDKNGNYTFSNFLPGNYVIRYHYGNKTETVLLHQNQENGANDYSYNGEDYQSTNNIGTYGANALNGTANIWYAYNEKEGVSTGTDNESRRSDVTTNVTNFTDEEMTILNNVRDGKVVEENEEKTLIEKTYMFATTPGFTLSVEKTETDDNNQNPTQKDSFSEYNIKNMNFGIAEVPVTTIDLQKHVAGFTIKDSAGDNTIASLTKNEKGEWVTTGDVLPSGDLYDVSIEDEKLQGARLEVTYNVTISMTTEKDFTNKELTIPTIDGIADFVDNDLSYNESLGENSKYWEVTTYNSIKEYFEKSQYKEGSLPQGTVDPEGTGYTTVLKAKEGNPILLKETGTASCPITLEKVLSSEEVTVGDIIASSINTYEYDNIVEITKLDYGNAKSEDGSIIFRDRVRTPNRYIILAGTQHDSAISETIAIHPPTGKNNSIIYYIITVISLGVLAVGIVLIKKYAIKK